MGSKAAIGDNIALFITLVLDFRERLLMAVSAACTEGGERSRCVTMPARGDGVELGACLQQTTHAA
jgi:hypothetical protein